MTELKGKATYAQVKGYIFNEFGLKVSSLYIAHQLDTQFDKIRLTNTDC